MIRQGNATMCKNLHAGALSDEDQSRFACKHMHMIQQALTVHLMCMKERMTIISLPTVAVCSSVGKESITFVIGNE